MAGEPSPRGALAWTWEDVTARLRPWSGEHRQGTDPNTLNGKVVCGYQGWFAAHGDGAQEGWVHYGDGIFKPGTCKIDLWPDMSEFGADERYPTEFRQADGSVAQVFSSYNSKTVNRHFQWMAQYGIDGVFLQRFGTDMYRSDSYDFCNAVLDNVRHAANANGRTWAVMYDLTGLSGKQLMTIIAQDWKNLVDLAQVRNDPAYQKHGGKPVIGIWGIGFNEGRKYSLKDSEALIDFFKSDRRYGGNSLLLGVPYGWRSMNRDSVVDPHLHDVLRKADIISPWSVTRYNSTEAFLADIPRNQQPDLAWCREQHLDYLPVIFPGFSWSNLFKQQKRSGNAPVISREDGRFFWKQGRELARLGANMLYVAMFDELDEGTAIMKCSANPPVGASVFQFEKGVAPDQYLWLAGQFGRLLRKELPVSDLPPAR